MLCSGTIKKTAAVINACNAVRAAAEAALAIAESEPLNERAAIIRLYNNMRKTAVKNAVKYELAKRNNERLARRVPGVRPVLMIDSFRQAIEHARRREEMLLDILEDGGETAHLDNMRKAWGDGK
jgi:hypothetical protein